MSSKPHLNVRHHIFAAKTARNTSTQQELWAAVIEQALRDAKWNPDNVDKESRSNGIPHTQMLNARGDALRWLRGNTEDFKTVCDLAGLNPSYVKRLAEEQLGEDMIWNNHFRIGRGEAQQGADT